MTSTAAARETRARYEEIVSISSQDAVQARLRQTRRRQRELEQDMFFLALETARRSPVTKECSLYGCATSADLKTRICDLDASWFSVVAGFSADYSAHVMLCALEVAERLPLLFARLLEGRTRPYLAQRVAEETLRLSDEAARFVDAQVAAAGAVRGRWAIKGLVREAMIAHMPQGYAALQKREADPRRAHVFLGADGTGQVEATVSLLAAADLDQTLAYGAEQLKAAGSGDGLDARRSLAFEDVIAAAHDPEPVRQGAFDLTGGTGVPGAQAAAARGKPATGAGSPDGLGGADAADASDMIGGTDRHGPIGAGSSGQPTWSGRGVPRATVLMYLHIDGTAFWPDGHPGATPIDPDHVARRRDREPVRIEGPGVPKGTVITAAEVAAMFTPPGNGPAAGGCHSSSRGPRITVRPVLDLNEEQQVEGYVAGEVIKEHLHLRDRTCVFPHCTYTARACDCDHIDPWRTDEHGNPTGGPTCTCNLAALCRTHHRWKTHGHHRDRGRTTGRSGWSYVRLGPDTYYWQGPRGLRFLRTPEGTIEVTDQAWHHRDLQDRYDDLAQREHHEHEYGLVAPSARAMSHGGGKTTARAERRRLLHGSTAGDFIETLSADPPRR